ncbi:MAG: dUTP diphosphatase [Thermohalobaculum sp.]|nr:dUTP diphosphatase [Thermohalobaculum sp.]
MTLEIAVAPLDHHDPALPWPTYETEGAAGMDLRASLMAEDRAAGIALPPMGRALIPTGLAMAIPAGFEGQVRPRSGLAARHGVTVLNAPGTIDSDYRGELRVLLVNLGPETFRVRHGERIAQLVIAPVTRVRMVRAGTLDATARGAGGFGSTGQG